MSQLSLWYREPAGADWNRALPIGAGRLGAMIFGNVTEERVQLNEDTVWNGGPRDRNNPDARTALPEIRRLIREGKLAQAEELTNDALCGVPDIMRNYEPLGDLLFTIRHTGPATEYRRALDLETAIATVEYQVAGVTFQREYLASQPDQVIAIRLTADQPGAISLRLRLERGPRDNYATRYIDTMTAEDGCALVMDATAAGAQGVHIGACLRATAEGGTLRTIGENLHIDGADAVTLLLTAATSFREADPIATCRARAIQAAARPWNELQADHLAEYQPYFQRVSLCLGAGADDLPTDERLQRVRDGHADPALDALYFHYGRYLLIAASRPDSLPANLQGIWNQDFSPAWGSKYTININTEMNYWPAEVCNLPEIHQPLFDLVERLRAPGRRTAQVMYGCRGFVCHHNTDLWADTCPVDRNLAASYWLMGGAWLSLHLWEHIAFTGDTALLRRAYDTLKEASLFFVDYLIEDEKGRLVTCPTSSPENTYLLPNGEHGTLCMGASMDNQILDQLFRACLQAGEMLGVDADFHAELEGVRQRLPQPSIGRHGQLMEWPEDYDEIEQGHRHISHLFALYPGDMISPRTTPELAQAARVTLDRRLQGGGGGTGWSRAWIINFWARLLDGERAYQNFQALLATCTLPNLFDNHPPFQIDGNFGGTAGVAEMLLQSAHGAVEVLPALPQAWPTGDAHGLCARGGFVLDFQWDAGVLTGLTLCSRLGGPCTLRYHDTVRELNTTAGETLHFDGALRPTE